MTRIPSGGLLVGSREQGMIYRVGPDGRATEVGIVRGLGTDGEGALLGLAVQSGFPETNDWIYLYYARGRADHVVRFAYYEDQPPGEQLGATPDLLLDNLPASAVSGNGSLEFGPDGMLYVGVAPSPPGSPEQENTSWAGKILRITPDGFVPQDNPVPGSPAYAAGHAGAQGLAWDAGERLWAVDAVPGGEVEVNSVAPGGDYGWPEVSGIVTDAAEQGYVNPVDATVPAEEEPSGLAHAGGSLWMTTAGGATLWRFPLDGTQLVAGARPQPFREAGGEELGALRDVLATPEGGLLVLTGDGRLLRLAVR